jgi:hypothetical protein
MGAAACVRLAVQVGLVQSEMTPEARRAAYASDITYVTNSELGFDYLRDNLAGVSQHTGAGVLVADRQAFDALLAITSVSLHVPCSSCGADAPHSLLPAER